MPRLPADLFAWVFWCAVETLIGLVVLGALCGLVWFIVTMPSPMGE